MRISHEVESRRGGQLDVFVIGRGLNRRECHDQGRNKGGSEDLTLHDE